MIGVDLYTHHTHPQGLCSNTQGVYIEQGGYAAGVLRNSECRTSAWLAWAPQTNVVTFGSFKAKAGLLAGVITGYRSSSVLPVVSPSAALQAWRGTWARLSYLPRSPGAQSDGWHLSIEYEY